jgi:uncharacterized protein YjbI with pentapeptide repeats
VASAEAVSNLLNSEAAWAVFRQENPGPIDLSFAVLSDGDLRRRDLSGCDLTSAHLDGASLDEATITDANLTSADLGNSSLTDVRLTRVMARKADLSDAVINRATFTDTDLSLANLSHVTSEATQLDNSQLVGANLDGAHFTDVRISEASLGGATTVGLTLTRAQLSDCDFSEWQLMDSSLIDSTFDKSTLRGVKLTNGRFCCCRITACSISKYAAIGTEVADLDLSGSVVREVDVAQLDPPSAVLLDTAFVNCRWPDQAGRVGVLGGYRPSAALLSHPVQDVKGVPPLLRREIADAQFLVRRLAGSTSPLRRGVMRAWGATSGYGQSAGRLLAFAALIILAHTVLLMAVQGEFTGAPDFGFFCGRVGDVAVAFANLADSDADADGAAKAVLLSVRLAGFISLGIWVTVASNRLSRLAGG